MLVFRRQMQELKTHADGVVGSLHGGTPAQLHILRAQQKKHTGSGRQRGYGFHVAALQADIAEVGEDRRRAFAAA